MFKQNQYIYLLKAQKRSEIHVLLKRKNHIVKMSKTKYKKQNQKKVINAKIKVVVGAYLSLKKDGLYNIYHELLSKKMDS